MDIIKQLSSHGVAIALGVVLCLALCAVGMGLAGYLALV